ncbi:MAG: hypothetical protein LBF55_05465 [Prevotellaceae bacterium]|jgi:hypothetical protein|nr:hypothetical protein [Prevotellaceae bacterium]
MKKAALTPLFAVSLSLLAAHSCSSDTYERAFDATVIAPDDEGLPKYTEYGFNTAGAEIASAGKDWASDDKWSLYYWSGLNISNVHIEQLGGGWVQFFMKGMTTSLASVDIAFNFPGEIPDTLTGLRALVGQEFSVQRGNLLVDFPATNKEALTGQVHVSSATLRFTRSRVIYTNANNREGVSLSGTFEITGSTPDGGSVTVSSGRFDILFYNYNGGLFSNAFADSSVPNGMYF